MTASVSTSFSPATGASLRRELNARALTRAARLGLRHELTTGRSPGVVFGPDIDAQGRRRHGNFDAASYEAICAQPEWARRLGKAHTGSLRALPRADWRWRELDCASSSDALLMNIFCNPETLHSPQVAALLGVDRSAQPRFGIRPRIPLVSGLADTTEIDMQLDNLLVEAKLTESNFQTARPALVARFLDLHEVFDVDRLPRTRAFQIDEQWDEEQAAVVAVLRGHEGHFASYQLIRGALAAYATGTAFCVFCDGRRSDLIEAWHRVLSSVRPVALRCRLQLLTWQELASALPGALRALLRTKYGIEAA